MELKSKYKSVLITGGAQRIGKSIAKYLAESGYNVAIQYNKSHKKANDLRDYYKKSKIKFATYKFDFEKGKNIMCLIIE